MEQFLASIPQFRNAETFNSLFSAFKDKQLNPEDYEYKLNFWKKIIIQSMELGYLRDECGENSLFSFDLSTLKKKFTINGIYPLGLTLVMQELCKDHVFQSKEEFLKPEKNQSNSSLLLSPFYALAAYASSWKWSWSGEEREASFEVSTTEEEEENTLFVNVQSLEDSAQRIKSLVEMANLSPSDCIYTQSQFEALVLENIKCLNAQDLNYLATFMKKKGYLLEVSLTCKTISSENSTETGKIYCFLPDSTTTKTTKLSSNSETLDLARAIGQIKLALEKIQLQSQRFEEAFSLANARLNECIQTGNKNAALFQLKRRKAIEKTIQKAQNSTVQLEEMLLAIDASSTQNQTCKALALGIEKAHEMLRQPDFVHLERQLIEVREKKQETEAVFNAVLSSNAQTVEDEVQLENELQELVQQSSQNDQEKVDSILQRIEKLDLAEEKQESIHSKKEEQEKVKDSNRMILEV